MYLKKIYPPWNYEKMKSFDRVSLRAKSTQKLYAHAAFLQDRYIKWVYLIINLNR